MSMGQQSGRAGWLVLGLIFVGLGFVGASRPSPGGCDGV